MSFSLFEVFSCKVFNEAISTYAYAMSSIFPTGFLEVDISACRILRQCIPMMMSTNDSIKGECYNT